MSAKSANYTYWNGSVDSNWDTAGNWNSGVPDNNAYAQFGSPYATPFTITVNDLVKAYAFYVSESRTAGLTFTGTGAIETYRPSEVIVPNNGPCLLTFEVAVTNASGGDQTILGNSIFKKDLFIGTDHSFYIGSSGGSRASVALADNGNLTSVSLTIYNDSSLVASNTAALNLTGDSYLKVYKQNSFLGLYDDATLNGKYFSVYSGASAEIADNSRVNLSRDLNVYPGGRLTISGNPVINLRKLSLPFSPKEGVNDEWTMGGGEILSMVNDDGYRLEMPYTNATKTVSGTGTFCMYRPGFDNASNLVFRLMGPNMYVRTGYISSSNVGYKRVRFEIGGGSTFGMWGADYDFNRWTNRVVGAATIDTTDYSDKTTKRTITLSNLFDCNGVLTVKGVGTCSLGSPDQPNLSLVGTDSSTITCASGYAFADIALTDSAKLTSSAYLGHKGEESYRIVKSLTMDEDSKLNVKRYVILSGDATLSGNANAVVRNADGESNPIFKCDNLSLSDNASLSVTGTIAATSLTMSGNARLAFTAGTAFSAGATFGAGNWTMEITIPSGYEAGIRPVVIGAGFEGDFADHVTLIGDTTGWSARTLDGSLILYKDAPPSGIEWIGDSSTSDNWSDAANWNGGNIPTAGDCVAFGGLDRLTPYNDSVSSVSSIVFRASAGPFVLSGSGDLKLTADTGGRGSSTAANASIASHSAFEQTIASFIDFDQHNACVLSDGGGALKLTGGLKTSSNWRYFVVGGDVRFGGTCSIGILSLKTSATAAPTCMRILPNCDFTITRQGLHSFVDSSSYYGKIFVEEGGVLNVKDGDCCFHYGQMENVIDGTLNIKSDQDAGRLVCGQSEQYYIGKGAIYADSARSARYEAAASHYINLGGTLKLYMNGNWYTATYYQESGTVYQNPNIPSRFKMTDGTTLGATKDWYYGPREGAYDTIANTITPADRMSVMTGTVTVNTLDPKDGTTAHTITFIDPLDASDANLVKAGAGTLVFNEAAGYPSQVSNLTVNAGAVQFTGAAPTIGSVAVADGATVSFASVPTFSGTLTLASTGAGFLVDDHATSLEWDLIATAADIVGPDGAVKWKADNQRRFKVESEGGVKKLYGARGGSCIIIVR